MPEGTVRIVAPAGRQVYINGDYEEPDPPLIPCTLLVEYGANVFETLTATHEVDYSRTVVTNDDNPHATVSLNPL